MFSGQYFLSSNYDKVFIFKVVDKKIEKYRVFTIEDCMCVFVFTF